MRSGGGGGGTLADCFPGENFDYVIASHVIEHVPDLIGFLSEVADILKPTGRLILAIPDRRYTFDFLRRETRLSDVIDNYLRQVKRPTPGQIFDAFSNAVDFDHMKAWSESPPTDLKHFVDHSYCLSKAMDSQNGEYVDAHCSVFTATSLLQLLSDLLALRLLRFRMERFHIAPRDSAEMSLVLMPLGTNAEDEVIAARSSIETILSSGVDSEGLNLDTIEPANEDPGLLALKKALEDMQSSTSWRLTAPIRAVMNRLRRLQS